jgi:hypothetical protein
VTILPWNATARQLRQFALFAPAGFAAIGWMAHRFGAPWSTFWILVGVGVVLLVAGLARPTLLRPVWILSLMIAMPIGFVVTTVAMAAVYYLVITPIGLVFRLGGRDALGLKTRGWTKVAGPDDPGAYYRQS